MKKAILFIYIDIGEIVKCTENSYVTLLLAIISEHGTTCQPLYRQYDDHNTGVEFIVIIVYWSGTDQQFIISRIWNYGKALIYYHSVNAFLFKTKKTILSLNKEYTLE